MYQFPLLLILTIHLASSQYSYGPFYSTPEPHNCRDKEATSFTLLTDNPDPGSFIYASFRLVFRLSDRYPCSVRQYRAIKLNNTDTTENAVTTKDEFLNTITNYYFWNYYESFYSFYNDVNYYKQHYCKQSLLLGLKKALDISPAGSFILVISSGSMADSDDIVLLNQIFRLLEEKRSQVFFAVYNHCDISSKQENIFNEIASQSFGHYLNVDDYSISQVIYGLDLYLAKPLNSSLRIVNINLNTNGVHTEVFNVATSLTYLLITTGGNANFTLIDSSGNSVKYEQVLSYVKGKSYLVKSPISGIWYIEITNEGNSSVKVLGFTDFESQGNCYNYDCHPDATCEEFGGYQQCTCKQGYKGDGIVCYDIDECDDYWVHNCNYGYCVNSIGSYNCSCYSGFAYEQGLGCIDIDECASAELNDCHSLAVCKNNFGWYTCSCPDGYFGDGRYCEVNECEQKNGCFGNTECIKIMGSHSCIDPCSSHTVLDEQWRLASGNSYNYWMHCDYFLDGWYRFQGKHDQRIPEHCIPEYSCGTHAPMWINGLHPTPEEGIVNRTACASWLGNCCMWSSSISILSCPGGFYVYKINGVPACNLGYCVEPQLSELNCSTAYCSPDEECKRVNGVSECHCKDDLYDNDGLDSNSNSNYLIPELECGSNQIMLSYSKCLLERKGLDTSTIHLRDSSCTGYTERWDKSYVKIEMLPRSGSCGAQLLVNESHLTYANTLYISPKTSSIIQRGEIRLNFSCSYPLNMEVSLWIAVNPFISSINIDVGGTGTYTAKMALYQYSDYTAPYEGSEVWLSTESMLYAGVIIENTQEPNLVLVMRNCYVTPTDESWNPVRHYIIRDSCPNRNDPTISVAENGISLQGRFSIQVFKFVGNYDKIYLHCQIRLCDTTSEICNPQCLGMRSASTNSDANTVSLSLGPLRLKASSETPQPAIMPAALSSGKATTSSLVTLTLTLYLLAMIRN